MQRKRSNSNSLRATARFHSSWELMVEALDRFADQQAGADLTRAGGLRAGSPLTFDASARLWRVT